MDLALKLSLDHQDYLYGESILAMLTLTNRGKSSVNLPSLDMNDTVVSYQLQDSAGKEIGSYNGVDFQKRVGEPRIRRDRIQMQTLGAGEDEEVSQDLLLLREPLKPGRYKLSSRYQWKEITLESASASFEVHPSKAERPAVGWDNDQGGPFHLLLAWVDHLKGSTFLMQASTFGADSRAFDHVTRLRQVQGAEELALTRDLGKVAEMESTLIWKEDGKLRWLNPDEGSEGAVGEYTPSLPGWRIVPSPYRESENRTVALISSATGDRVLALALPSTGSASVLGEYKGKPAARSAFVYAPSQGTLYLFVPDGDPARSRLEKVRLGANATSEKIWEDARAVLDVTAVVDASGQPAAALAVAGDQSGEVYTVIFRGAALNQQLKGPAFRVPQGSKPRMALGADRSVYLFDSEPGGKILFAAGGGELAPIEAGPFQASSARLAIGRSGRVFVVGVGSDGGILAAPLREAPGTPGVRGKGGEEE